MLNIKKNVYLAVLVLLITISVTPIQASENEPSKGLFSGAYSFMAAATIGLVVTAVYIKNFFKADTSLPKVEQLNIVTFIPIKKAEAGKPNSSNEAALKILKQKKISNLVIINGMIYQVQRGVPASVKDIQKPISVYSGGYSNDGRP